MSMLNRWRRGESNGGSREMQERGGGELGEWMRPMMNLQERINDVFDDFFGGMEGRMPSLRGESSFGTAAMPRMDISETSDAFRVTADVPGMTEDDIEITVSDNQLAISGERSREEEHEEEDFVRRERSYGMFHRRIPLPGGIDRDEISATFKNGELNIEMPKSEEAKSNWRQIEVKSE